MGLFYQLVTESTKSAGSSIVLHVVNNIFSSFLPTSSATTVFTRPAVASLRTIPVCLVLSLFLLFFDVNVTASYMDRLLLCFFAIVDGSKSRKINLQAQLTIFHFTVATYGGYQSGLFHLNVLFSISVRLFLFLFLFLWIPFSFFVPPSLRSLLSALCSLLIFHSC